MTNPVWFYEVWFPEDINETQRAIIERMVALLTKLKHQRRFDTALHQLHKKMIEEIKTHMFISGHIKIECTDKYVEEADRIHREYVLMFNNTEKQKSEGAKELEGAGSEGAKELEGAGS